MSSQKILQLLANTSMADKALRYAFNQIDKDKNGFITPQEFELVIQQFASYTNIPTPPSFIIRQSIKVFDTNRDGVISYDEFKVFAYETLKLHAQHQDPNHPSYQQNQGAYQTGDQNQGGHLPSNVQGLGQGRDAYPGGNQYQGQQAPYQGTNQPQGMQGQYQGGQYQMQNNQGQGQHPGGNQYQGQQAPYQGTNQHQGMPGQYQGGQYQAQNVQGGQINENYAPNIQELGYPGGNQYQQMQGQYQGTNQPQGMPGQYQGGQYQMQNVQGQGQGRDAYPGGNQYREMQGQHQGGQHQTQNVQGGGVNEHLPSNVGQGRDAYQNQYGNYSAY